MVVSVNEEAQYRPQNTIILSIGTPKKGPLLSGNPRIGLCRLQGYVGVIGTCTGDVPMLVVRKEYFNLKSQVEKQTESQMEPYLPSKVCQGIIGFRLYF